MINWEEYLAKVNAREKEIAEQIERRRVGARYCAENSMLAVRHRHRYSESREFNYENDSWGSATIATVRTESIYEAYAEYQENGKW